LGKLQCKRCSGSYYRKEEVKWSKGEKWEKEEEAIAKCS